MEKDFWLKKWRNRDIGFHQQDVNPDLITYLNKLKLHLGNHILVPLCGKTRDMLWLADKKYQITGVELSPIACEEFFSDLKVTAEVDKQKKFTKSKYQNIELLCGDFFELQSQDLQSIDAVYDCKALVALAPEQRKKYVDHLVACVGTKIKILLLAMESPCPNGPPFSLDKKEIEALYGPYFKVKLIKREPVKQISERLAKKGFSELTETVYLISE